MTLSLTSDAEAVDVESPIDLKHYSVLLIDDHALIRSALRDLLKDERSVTRVAEAASGREALQKLQEERFDLVILDINLPDCNGMEVLNEIQAMQFMPRVLVLSGLSERQYAINVLRAGANAFLNKECSSEELLKAVKLLLAGKRYVTPAIAEILATGTYKEDSRTIHDRLSTQEFKVFDGLAKGMSISEIAEQCSISIKTASTYRTRLLEKLNFKNNAEVTTYALRNGLIA